MAIDIARLRSIARGETIPKNGRNAVTDPSGVTGYAIGYAKKPQSYAGYAGYAQNLQGRKNNVGEGVTRGVTEPLDSAPAVIAYDNTVSRQREADRRNAAARRARITDRWCACGTMATLAVGSFRAEKGDAGARWLCVECFEKGRCGIISPE